MSLTIVPKDIDFLKDTALPQGYIFVVSVTKDHGTDVDKHSRGIPGSYALIVMPEKGIHSENIEGHLEKFGYLISPNGLYEVDSFEALLGNI
jgi:hypothetical protein